jgi:hypothetical protein
MKPLIFCTSLMLEESLHKYAMWWKYYRTKFPEAHLIIANDGPIEGHVFDKFMSLTDGEFEISNLVVFEEKLGRDWHYHWGWWRSFLTVLRYGKQNEFSKIIHIESDAVILSKRLFNFIINENNGWKCLFTKKYNFPESAIQIINPDSFYLIDNLPEQFSFDTIAELFLPFKAVKNFIGDRYGENCTLPSHKIDYVCQWDWMWQIEKEWIIDD